MIKKHLQLGLLLMVSLFFPCLALTEQEKALFKACEEHDHLKINQLLAEGVNINVLNEKQQTPLYVAIDTFNFDAEEDIKKVVATLLHNNANPNLGEGYFFPLCTAVETGYKSIVKLLIDYAADTAIFFASGDTLFHIAASKNRDSEVMQLLLSKTLNKKEAMNRKNNSQATPLYDAIITHNYRHNKIPMMKYMIKIGIDVNAGEGDTIPIKAAFFE